MFSLMGQDHSKISKKTKQPTFERSDHKYFTSSAVQKMENGDIEQEGRRLFLDEKARRKEKRKEIFKDFSKLTVTEAARQQPRKRSVPFTQDSADNFETNFNSNPAAEDGLQSKCQTEINPNDCLNHHQVVSNVSSSSSWHPGSETDRVCDNASLGKTMAGETVPVVEKAMTSRNVLGNMPGVTQKTTQPTGPSLSGSDMYLINEPELDHIDTLKDAQSGIHDNNSSPSRANGHQHKLESAADTFPLVDQGTASSHFQTDSGVLPSSHEGFSGRAIEGTSLHEQTTTTSASGVQDPTRSVFVAHNKKIPSTGNDLSDNPGQLDSADGVPQLHDDYVTDMPYLDESFPPTQASKPESATPSAMQIVGAGLDQKEDTRNLTVDEQFISKAVTENTLLLDKLSKYLDRESRVIKCWKHLAFVLKVPAEETRTFDMYTEHSPTEDMFNYLADIWNPDLKVRELKTKLRTIYRNDVIDSLTKEGYHDEMKVADLMSGQPKFIAMLSSKLDKESRTIGDWKSLATQFGIRKQMTEQFGLSGSGPTAALFLHMRTDDVLKDLTIGELRAHFEAMERKDLLNVLKKHNCQDSSDVREVAVNGSELLADIGERLNKDMRAVKNWRNLAYRLKIPHETYEAFDISKGAAKSPTKMLFEWLSRSKPSLTVKDLLNGLKEIDRFDVVDFITKEVATALENLKKQEADLREGSSEPDGATQLSTAKQTLCSLQQMHHHPKKADRKADLFNDLRKKAAAQGFRIVNNEGMGNCMFSALSHQLQIKKGVRYSDTEIRTVLVQYLKDHRILRIENGSCLDLFDFVDPDEYPEWTDYLEKMAQNGCWGDQVILEAAARHFNCVIRIISSHPDPKDIYIMPDSTTSDVAELVLGHIREYHYVSLEPAFGYPAYHYPGSTMLNRQLPVSQYQGHPPHFTNTCLMTGQSQGYRVQGNQQSQGHHQSVRCSKEEKNSTRVTQLPLSVYSKICLKLNIRRDWSFDDFRMVAEELGMDRDTTNFIGQQTNPTDSIFSVLYPNVTVLQLINILHKIERLDAAAVLEQWVNDA